MPSPGEFFHSFRTASAGRLRPSSTVELSASTGPRGSVTQDSREIAHRICKAPCGSYRANYVFFVGELAV